MRNHSFRRKRCRVCSSKHQRMQIGLSDSNLSDAATLVKVGSVALILDMIDAGATTQNSLVLGRPLRPPINWVPTGIWCVVSRQIAGTRRHWIFSVATSLRWKVTPKRLSGDQRKDADEIVYPLAKIVRSGVGVSSQRGRYRRRDGANRLADQTSSDGRLGR